MEVLVSGQEQELAVVRDYASAEDPPGGGTRALRRRTALAGAIVVGVAALLMTVALVGRDDKPVNVAAAAVGDTSTTAPMSRETTTTTAKESAPTTVPTSTTAPATTAPIVAPEPTAPPTTAPRRPPTTAPTSPTTAPAPPGPVCRNSYDPVCGSFYWDPAPVNQPLTASFVDMPTRRSLLSGGLDMSVHVSDPDAALVWASVSVNGVPVSGIPRVRNCDWIRPRYGAWTPGQPMGSASGTSFVNPVYFTEPGTYLVELSLGTGMCGDAFASDTLLTATVEVVDDQEPPEPEV
jgi:hypothetical protein